MARPLPAKAENFFTAVYRIQKATFPVPQIPRGLLTTPAEKLPDLFGQVSLVNLPLFPLVHGLLIACDLRRATAVGFARDPLKRNVQSPVQSLLASIFASNGGSFLVAYAFAEPLSLLLDDRVLPLYIVAWLLAHYSPGDVVYRLFLLACTIFEPAFSIFEGFSLSLAVTSYGVDKIRSSSVPYSTSRLAAFSCAVLTGTGGGLFLDSFNMLAPTWSLQIPPLIMRSFNPFSFGVVVTTIGYMFFTDDGMLTHLGVPHWKLDPLHAKFFVGGFLMLVLGAVRLIRWSSQFTSSSTTTASPAKLKRASSAHESPKKSKKE